MLRKFYIRPLLLSLLLATPVTASNIPPALFVKIVLAALAFDRNLESRFGTEISISVVGKSDYAKQLEKTVGLAAEKTIKGATLNVVDGGSTTPAANIILYGDALGGSRSDAIAHCQKTKATCVSVDPQDVESGISLGVELQGGKPKLMINMQAATLVGADYSSQILRLANVVGQ